MKRTRLLNRHLSALIATLGHGDCIVLADAGLPVPRGISVIDLAVVAGMPGLFDVLAAIGTELVIERAIYASEADSELVSRFDRSLDWWSAEQGQPIRRECIPHEALKLETSSARAIIRTGEVTPYTNIILVSGVAF